MRSSARPHLSLADGSKRGKGWREEGDKNTACVLLDDRIITPSSSLYPELTDRIRVIKGAKRYLDLEESIYLLA